MLTNEQKEFINKVNKHRIDTVIYEYLSKKGKRTFDIQRTLGKINLNSKGYTKQDKEIIEEILGNTNMKKHIKYEFINDHNY